MDIKRNGFGYVDPTATEAILTVDKEERSKRVAEVMTEAEKEEERFKRLFGAIRYICEIANFRIEGRIVLVDKETGRIWR